MSLLRNKALCIIFIAAISFCAYSAVLPASFKTIDDAYSIVENERIRSVANLPLIFTTSFFGEAAYYRPLVSLSYMLEYHLVGYSPFLYYFDNICLHILSAILVFLIIGLLTGDRRASFFIALLFAIHPVHWEAVTNLSGRAILLCALFYLWAFYLFIRSKKTRSFCVGASLCFILALFSKESAGVFPLLVTAYVFFIEKERAPNKLIGRVLPYYIIALAYVIWRKGVGLAKVNLWPDISQLCFGFLSFLRSVLTHLRTLIIPNDLHFDRMQRLFHSVMDVELIVTVLVWMAVVAVMIRWRKKIPSTFAFLGVWFGIDLLPVSQIFAAVGVQPGYIMAADHFLYTASIPVFAILVLAAEPFLTVNAAIKKISPKVASGAVLLLLTGYFLMTVRQAGISSDEMRMYQQSLEENPKNTRIRSSVGMAYARMGMIDTARLQLEKVLHIDPDNVKARIGLGKTYCDEGRYAECVMEYEKVSDPKKFEKLLSENIRVTYNELIDQYRKLLREDPANAQIYYSLGVAYQRNGRFRDAIEEYHHAILLEPNYKNALFNLASSYYAQEEKEKAVLYFGKMLDLSGEKTPLDVEASRQAAQISEELGDVKAALYYQTLAEKFLNKMEYR